MNGSTKPPLSHGVTWPEQTGRPKPQLPDFTGSRSFGYRQVTGGPNPQTIQTASYGANRLGLEAGKFVLIDLGGPNEEYVKIISTDPDNQRFDAIVIRDHAAGERIRPTIWPTPVLYEGDDLAFDILSVASPDSGFDLTVVVQT